MTIIRIRKIIWDAQIKEHIAKHKVTIDEAKNVINSDAFIIDGHSGKKIIINRSGDRILSIIVKMHGNILRIATARDADTKERKEFYEYEKSKA